MEGKGMEERNLENQLYNDMVDLVSFGYRYPGSDAEKKAAQYIINKLKDSGINAVYEEYEARCYRYTRQSVRAICSDKTYEFTSHPVWLSKEM